MREAGEYIAVSSAVNMEVEFLIQKDVMLSWIEIAYPVRDPDLHPSMMQRRWEENFEVIILLMYKLLVQKYEAGSFRSFGKLESNVGARS